MGTQTRVPDFRQGLGRPLEGHRLWGILNLPVEAKPQDGVQVLVKGRSLHFTPCRGRPFEGVTRWDAR